MEATVPSDELGVFVSDGNPLSVAVDARVARGRRDHVDSQAKS